MNLGEMLRDELRHFKHAHLTLAPENLLERCVSIDVALILRILKVVLLDIYPELLNYLRARHRALADNLCKLIAHIERLHKC